MHSTTTTQEIDGMDHSDHRLISGNKQRGESLHSKLPSEKSFGGFCLCIYRWHNIENINKA